jgi:hypothetical protein
MEVKNTNFYDMAGILIPGVVTLYFVARQERELQVLLNDGDVTVGGAAIFLALAYATGQLVAAVSNLIEPAIWLGKGAPQDWPRRGPSRVLSSSQIGRLERKLGSECNECVEINGSSKEDWAASYSEIYRLVMKRHPGRSLMFNAIYGMSRGLAFSFSVLAAWAALDPKFGLSYAVPLFAAALIFAIRARRFGINLVREVLVNFIVMAPERRGTEEPSTLLGGGDLRNGGE